mmetsp:Transcript_30350/g.45734  ORF Transcript_30350/g.45734 Transcript_30350/m.45734 type:complete len:85 (-) Transcript_30350:683-937(-)
MLAGAAASAGSLEVQDIGKVAPLPLCHELLRAGIPPEARATAKIRGWWSLASDQSYLSTNFWEISQILGTRSSLSPFAAMPKAR